MPTDETDALRASVDRAFDRFEAAQQKLYRRQLLALVLSPLIAVLIVAIVIVVFYAVSSWLAGS